MKRFRDAEMLRIFIGEKDEVDGRPLYERIVEEAHDRGLAGATVLRGVLGYGVGSRIHTPKVLRLAEDLPLVVEIVDTTEKLEAFLPALEGWIDTGLVTVEPIRAWAIGDDSAKDTQP